MSPFFEGEISVVPYLDSNCLVIGKESKKGKKRLYSLYCSPTDPDKSLCKRIFFPFDVNYVSSVDFDTLLFLTNQGLCFVDNKTFEQKSDFYDALYFNKDSNVNSWIYEKEVVSDNLKTILTGPISKDGIVGSYAYDTFFRKPREVVTDKISRYQYDVIDTSSVSLELTEKEQDDNLRKRAGIRKALRKASESNNWLRK